MKTVNCPACGAKGIHAVASGGIGFLREGDPLGPCGACGWCRHARRDHPSFDPKTGMCERCARPFVHRKNWCEPDHLPKPRDMGDEEFAFRAGLFVVWMTRPASELASQFLIFADWLQERGSAEEVAARADWRAYASKRHDPAGWYQWSVPAGKGWIELSRRRRHPWSDVFPPEGNTFINYDRARLTKSMHNGRWLLCWPPGFCRFTAPLSHDPSRWRVTVEANRLSGSTPSRPVERVWPGGYSTLVAPFGAPPLEVRAGLTVERQEDLGLFAEGM